MRAKAGGHGENAGSRRVALAADTSNGSAGLASAKAKAKAKAKDRWACAHAHPWTPALRPRLRLCRRWKWPHVASRPRVSSQARLSSPAMLLARSRQIQSASVPCHGAPFRPSSPHSATSCPLPDLPSRLNVCPQFSMAPQRLGPRLRDARARTAKKGRAGQPPGVLASLCRRGNKRADR